jgi:hypothetical protein
LPMICKLFMSADPALKRAGSIRNGFPPGPCGQINKHPPIGAGRELFFVNINPRSTNNPAMEWGMESIANFREFACNRYKESPYIPDSESFYRLHAEICGTIFGQTPIEEIAVVHELYLCAWPQQQRRPLATAQAEPRRRLRELPLSSSL